MVHRGSGHPPGCTAPSKQANQPWRGTWRYFQLLLHCGLASRGCRFSFITNQITYCRVNKQDHHGLGAVHVSDAAGADGVAGGPVAALTPRTWRVAGLAAHAILRARIGGRAQAKRKSGWSAAACMALRRHGGMCFSGRCKSAAIPPNPKTSHKQKQCGPPSESLALSLMAPAQRITHSFRYVCWSVPHTALSSSGQLQKSAPCLW